MYVTLVVRITVYANYYSTYKFQISKCMFVVFYWS